jgi:hypothetical protein
MPETKKCEHPACTCMAPAESKYCSQSCEDAADMTEISCNCGHAGCELGTDATIPSATRSATFIE